VAAEASVGALGSTPGAPGPGRAPLGHSPAHSLAIRVSCATLSSHHGPREEVAAQLHPEGCPLDDATVRQCNTNNATNMGQTRVVFP